MALVNTDVEKALWEAMGRISQVIQYYDLHLREAKLEEILRLRASAVLLGDVISMERRWQKMLQARNQRSNQKPNPKSNPAPRPKGRKR